MRVSKKIIVRTISQYQGTRTICYSLCLKISVSTLYYLLRSISIGLGVLISLCLVSLHLKSCVIYICPLGLQ